MAATHFSGPLRIGSVREGSGNNTGTPLLVQTTRLTFRANGNITPFLIPAGATIVQAFVVVTTIWNSGTSAAISMGTSGDTDAFMTATSVRSSGQKGPTRMTNAIYVGDSDLPVRVTFTTSGSAPTAGEGVAVILYRQGGVRIP